jgi:hypothetical protein
MRLFNSFVFCIVLGVSFLYYPLVGLMRCFVLLVPFFPEREHGGAVDV